MQSSPNAAHLPRGSKTGAFGHSFHIELRLREQVVCERNAKAISVLRNVHLCAFMKEARKMTRACPRNSRQHF